MALQHVDTVYIISQSQMHRNYGRNQIDTIYVNTTRYDAWQSAITQFATLLHRTSAASNLRFGFGFNFAREHIISADYID